MNTAQALVVNFPQQQGPFAASARRVRLLAQDEAKGGLFSKVKAEAITCGLCAANAKEWRRVMRKAIEGIDSPSVGMYISQLATFAENGGTVTPEIKHAELQAANKKAKRAKSPRKEEKEEAPEPLTGDLNSLQAAVSAAAARLFVTLRQLPESEAQQWASVAVQALDRLNNHIQTK